MMNARLGARLVLLIRCLAAAAAISLPCVTALEAHRSSGMFELTNAIWVQGTVVRFDRIHPHSITTLEKKTRDGQVRQELGRIAGVVAGRPQFGSPDSSNMVVQRGRLPNRETASLRAYVDEITGLLNLPCE